jgi:hypothetical protein
MGAYALEDAAILAAGSVRMGENPHIHSRSAPVEAAAAAN